MEINKASCTVWNTNPHILMGFNEKWRFPQKKHLRGKLRLANALFCHTVKLHDLAEFHLVTGIDSALHCYDAAV